MVDLSQAERRAIERADKVKQMKDAVEFGADGMPDEWWEYLYEFEHAPLTTEASELRKLGVHWPRIDEVAHDSAAVHAALQSLVNALADRRHVYLYHTNHLDDLACYRRLVQETLHLEKKGLPVREHTGWHVDLVAERRHEYLRFYAPENERAESEAAGEVVPRRSPHSCQRDAELPQPEVPAGRAMIVSMPRPGSDGRAGSYFDATMPLAVFDPAG